MANGYLFVNQKIRSCFFKAYESKMVICVSDSAAAQHIEAPIYANNNHLRSVLLSVIRLMHWSSRAERHLSAFLIFKKLNCAQIMPVKVKYFPTVPNETESRHFYMAGFASNLI